MRFEHSSSGQEVERSPEELAEELAEEKERVRVQNERQGDGSFDSLLSTAKADVIGISRGRAMGMGDLKLAGAVGVFLGWPDIVFSLAFGFVIGAVWSVGLLLRKTKRMKDAVPFGPFIVAGIFAAFFAGQEIVAWYFGIFQL